MDILNASLQSIGFKYIPQHGTQAWSKRYDGFVLFVVKNVHGQLICQIRVGKAEVSIPLIIDFEWVRLFDVENGG